MSTVRTVLFSLALAGVAVQAGDADACGGCFHPPNIAQVVTEHRMVLALSTQQTTLWDQFQYSGVAAEFSWILPIRYTDRTRVEVASDVFMSMMDRLTTPTLQYPTPPPLAPDCQRPRSSFGFADSAASFDAASDSGVTVLREEVVGPYTVAVVRGTTGMGIRDWLRMNGYVVPSTMEPVIDHYLGLNMDFVALRLRPGKGIQRMVPVRVTVDGYQPRLPLRMVAAGVADRVALSLIVVAPSRIEAMNFPNGEIRDEELVYDWRNPQGVSGDVLGDEFAARNRAAGDRLWLTWTSEPRSLPELESASYQAENSSAFAPRRDAGAADAVDGGDGSVPPPRLAIEDVRMAFGALTTARITRLRANLPARMLDRDLDLAASDRGVRGTTYTFGRELNRPQYAACPWPTDDTDDSFGSCAAAPSRPARSPTGALLGAALAALTAASRWRRTRAPRAK